MTPKEFAESIYSQSYELDSRICYHDRRINKDHVYDIFSDFSGTDANTAKVDMLSEISENYEWYESRGRVVLNIQGRTLAGWLSYHLEKKMARADELALYALSHLYNRHTVVFGKNCPWCTIRATGDPKEAGFTTSCHVHLLYIGVCMFAPLKPRTDPIPQYIQDYQRESDANWARAPELNYAAYYNEEEYSDYVEIVGEKPQRKTRTQNTCTSRQHAPTCTSTTSQPIPPEYRLPAPHTVPAPTVPVGQPVFPGQDSYSVTYEFDPVGVTSTNDNNDNDNIEHIVTISNNLANAPVKPVNNLRATTNIVNISAVDDGVNIEPPGKENPIVINNDTTSSNKGLVPSVSTELVTDHPDIIDTPLTVSSVLGEGGPTPQMADVPTSPNTSKEQITDSGSEKYYMLDNNRECSVSLTRLKQETIDKYSMDHKNITKSSTSNSEVETSDTQQGMVLRTRPNTPGTSGTRPRRTTARYIDYSQMDVGSEQEEPVAKTVAKI